MTAPVVVGESLCKVYPRTPVRPRSLKAHIVSTLTGRDRSDARSGFTALEDVSLEVSMGDFFGVIGSNGSGKSTLLKLIAGIGKPSSGRLTTRGRISALLELGAGFHPDFTGRENVFLNGTLLGLPRSFIKKRFDQIVEFAEIGDFIDQPVRTYSSGMVMRLAFSVAINVDPDILIIDEILAVGDAAFQKKCLERIEAFKAAGIALIFVSHDHHAVERLCNRALWLDRGHVRGYGSSADVVSRYLEQVALDEAQRHGVETERIFRQESRWGTQDAVITGVRLEDEAGEGRFAWRTGSPVVLAIDYRADRPISDPVFGIAIGKPDGTLCYGTNTEIDGLALPVVDGPGTMKVRLPDLSLVPGTYHLDVAIHPRAGGHKPYDYVLKCLTFDVRDTTSDVGTVRLAHSWHLEQQRQVAGNFAPGAIPGRTS